MCRCEGRNGVIPALTVALKMTCVCVALFRPTASKLDHSLWTMTETAPHFNLHFSLHSQQLTLREAAFLHSWLSPGLASRAGAPGEGGLGMGM